MYGHFATPEWSATFPWPASTSSGQSTQVPAFCTRTSGCSLTFGVQLHLNCPCIHGSEVLLIKTRTTWNSTSIGTTAIHYADIILYLHLFCFFFFFFYHNQPLAQRTSSCECTPQTNKQTNTSNSNFQHHCHGLGKLVDGGKSPRLAALMILLITASYYSIKLSVCGSSTGSDTYTC